MLSRMNFFIVTVKNNKIFPLNSNIKIMTFSPNKIHPRPGPTKIGAIMYPGILRDWRTYKNYREASSHNFDLPKAPQGQTGCKNIPIPTGSPCIK